MAREMGSMDEFLGHRGNDRAGEFLGNWRKNKDGSGKARLNVFFHCKQLPIALWRHGMPKIVIREDEDGESVRRVWQGQNNCLEDEGVLRRQYHRFDDGSRKHPPRRCGVCRLVAAVDDMIEEGQLSWTAPLFRFVADDPKETQVIHAGGLCNRFGGDLSDRDKKEIREAGISLREAWKENWHAKLSYVMVVVVPEDLESGVQIAIETGLLGDKVKEVIGDAVEDAKAQGRPEIGDPTKHPYCIQWEHRDEEGLEFGKRYKARKMSAVQPTEELLKLIRGPKPDLSSVVAPHDQQTMRAILERACLVKNIPWDHIYAFDKEEPARPSALSQHPDMAGVGEGGVKVPFDDDDKIVACDKCGKPMAVELDTCPTCGTKYDVATGKILEAAQVMNAEMMSAAKAKELEAPPPQAGRRRMRRRGEGGTGPSSDNLP
jgi:hypothetical protein